ncbi:MAG: MogA/MoaB family molybdenum cofactor biosynthesis protein [Chitinivibrionales bacterium]|nr:MogA/MoaB family molybdenum cofactor biosynthesis protein [Chitinivibrionales bacterium]
MKVLVLTVSDRASAGEYEDRSGPAVAAVVAEALPHAHIERRIVPDEGDQILSALSEGLSMNVILTTGGTGLSKRDITPEVTEKFCDRLIPGIAEYIRAESIKQTIHAVLSRGVAGVKKNTLIINMPGSVKAASFCATLVAPILEHAASMVAGCGHE